MRYIRAYHHSGYGNLPVSRIVIHATVSSTYCGGAEAIAHYFASSSAGGSAHYVVDPCETIRCLPDDVIAWHAPPNDGSLGIELCAYADNSRGDWLSGQSYRMLERAAALTAELCETYGVPKDYINAGDLRRGAHGITAHNDVSDAWHQSTHWDPGPGFPWGVFVDMVTGSTGEDDTLKTVLRAGGHEIVTLQPGESYSVQLDAEYDDPANITRPDYYSFFPRASGVPFAVMVDGWFRGEPGGAIRLSLSRYPRDKDELIGEWLFADLPLVGHGANGQPHERHHVSGVKDLYDDQKYRMRVENIGDSPVTCGAVYLDVAR